MSSKLAAIKTAKQVAKEPFEILKTAPPQILGVEGKKAEQGGQMDTGNSEKAEESMPRIREKKIEEEKDIQKSRNLKSAFEAELKDIHREEVFKKVQQTILAGEGVNVNDFPELSLEQKQVLNALKETVNTNSQKGQDSGNILSEPKSKQKRGLFSGVRTRVERLKRRGEIRTGPSG